MKCKSVKVSEKAYLEDRGDGNHGKPQKLRLEKNPDAFLFTGTEKFKIKCVVCLDCGFIELNCSELNNLREALKS